MLLQQGWPEGMTMPGFGPMPFLTPFIQPFGGGDAAMAARIEALEQRIAALEKKMAQRSKARKINASSET